MSNDVEYSNTPIFDELAKKYSYDRLIGDGNYDLKPAFSSKPSSENTKYTPTKSYQTTESGGLYGTEALEYLSEASVIDCGGVTLAEIEENLYFYSKSPIITPVISLMQMGKDKTQE